MDDRSFTIRVPKRWVRVAMIVGVTALIVAPLTAIASHSFTDVPDSNTFHSDIEWMKDAGVTQGCNPPDNTQYCPDDNVTRGQMAAFMNRFAGYIGATDGTPAQADNATTAGDAATVDGMNADDLRVVAAAQVDDTVGGTDVSVVTTINEVTIDAPVAGVLLINGSVFVNTDTDALLGLETYVNGTEVGAFTAFDDFSPAVDDDDDEEQLAYSTAIEVAAGSHTVRQDIGAFDGLGNLIDANLFYNGSNLNVIFVPGGEATAAIATAETTSDGPMDGE